MGDVRTERLLLRPFRAEDAEAFAAVNADPLVVRYLGAGEPIDRAASDALLARIIAHWDEHGFGPWAAELRDGGRMIGSDRRPGVDTGTLVPFARDSAARLAVEPARPVA